MRRILFPAPLTFDLLGYGNDAIIEEILIRTGLMMGTYNADISAYGIVDSADPRTAISGGVRPFSVNVNISDTTTIDIQAGVAVFKTGEIIIINEAVTQVTLADSTPNSRNIVYINFAELETNPVLTRHNTLTNSLVSYLDSIADYIKVLKKEDYDVLSPAEQDLTIPLAIVTNQIVTSSSGSGTVERISIDMTRNTYANNRPWFSVVDAEHRSHVGTGAVSSNNIHGLSINDLSAAGNLTFLQVALDHGMVVSKDRAIAGVPGSLCSEKILASNIAVDDVSGTITGINGASYFKLSRVPRLIHRVEIPIKATGIIENGPGGNHLDDQSFTLDDGVNPPVTFVFDTNASVIETNTNRRVSITASNTNTQVRNNIISAINNAPVLDITASITPSEYNKTTLTNDKAGVIGNTTITQDGTLVLTGMSGGIIKELAPFWVPGSNIVALLPGEPAVADYINVIYTAVDAAEPIINSVNPTFKVKTPTDSEVVVSSGLFLESITNAELSFENEGPIPSKYTVYVDSAGALQKFPQTVFCYKKLSDIGFSLQSFENEVIGNSRLKVFLLSTTSPSSLDLQIQITGLDVDGNSYTETVKFDSTWAGNIAPSCAENPNQYVITDTTWSSVSNLIVTVNTGTSVDAAILVQALVDPVSVPAIADVLPVAEIIWNGNQVCNIRDIRPINTSLTLPNYMYISSAGPMTAAYNASLMGGSLFQYWAEDFDKPRLVTTQVTETTSGSGLIPTELSMTKVAKGLGRNDTYVSRPIPIKPYAGTATALRFIPIQTSAGFTLKARFFKADTGWADWQTLTAPYTINSGLTVNNLVKWQMVVTGPVEGMYVILTTSTGATGTAFINNLGAWVDGIFL